MDTLDTEEMVSRFQQRADAVRSRTMPPVAGAERLAVIKQAAVAYLAYALIADSKISLNGGILTIDLRPALPTDGAKITPKMLDSKSDLQDLIDGAEMFRGFSLAHGYLA